MIGAVDADVILVGCREFVERTVLGAGLPQQEGVQTTDGEGVDVVGAQGASAVGP